MAIKLIIDGYNLIKSTFLLRANLESSRDFLIEKLALYKKIKHFPITVVFDGWEGGHLQETKEYQKGIKVIFSRQGEKADSVIEKMTRNDGERFVIVTSDRLLAESVQRNRATVIPSQDFFDKLELTPHIDIKGLNEEHNAVSPYKLKTKKKGNPKKDSKKTRKDKRRLDKL